MASYGMNYLSSNWNYGDSESVVRNDFQVFKSNNVRRITLWLRWDAIQPSSPTSYSATFLNNVKNLCAIANEYGIQVDIDFHSGSGNDLTYALPDWISPHTFDTVATNPTYKQYWINMETYVVQYLVSLTNIPSFHLFNEPWVPDSAIQTSYLSLFTDTFNAISGVTDKPLSMRFGPSSFFSHSWYSRPEIWSLCDFMCLNIYIGIYGGHTVENLDRWLTLCSQNGKQAYISEYGAPEQDDEVQRQKVATQVAEFTSRNIPTTMLTQYGELYTSEYFNTRNQNTMLPRPAFYEASKMNPSGNVSLPYHNDLVSLNNLQAIAGTWSVS